MEVPLLIVRHPYTCNDALARIRVGCHVPFKPPVFAQRLVEGGVATRGQTVDSIIAAHDACVHPGAGQKLGCEHTGHRTADRHAMKVLRQGTYMFAIRCMADLHAFNVLRKEAKSHKDVCAQRRGANLVFNSLQVGVRCTLWRRTHRTATKPMCDSHWTSIWVTNFV